MSVNWRSLPSLSSLRAFEATAAQGGFAGAARALNVTHAAVAQQVRGLEALLGVRLAVRQGRGIVLTEAGERLADALTDGFGRIAGAVEALGEEEKRRGLRITTTQFLVDEVIMPNLSQFWEKHPGVEIAFYPAREFIDIEGEGFDCGVRVISPQEKPDWPGLEAVFLSRTPMHAVGSPDLVGDGSGDPQEMPWLHHDNMDSKIRVMALAGLKTDDLRYVRIGSAQLQLQALRQSLGLTMFSERIGRKYIDEGVLAVQRLRQQTHLDYYGVYPKGPRRALVDEFIAWVGSLL